MSTSVDPSILYDDRLFWPGYLTKTSLARLASGWAWETDYTRVIAASQGALGEAIIDWLLAACGVEHVAANSYRLVAACDLGFAWTSRRRPDFGVQAWDTGHEQWRTIVVVELKAGAGTNGAIGTDYCANPMHADAFVSQVTCTADCFVEGGRPAGVEFLWLAPRADVEHPHGWHHKAMHSEYARTHPWHQRSWELHKSAIDGWHVAAVESLLETLVDASYGNFVELFTNRFEVGAA